MGPISNVFDNVRLQLGMPAAPVIVFCKSHSGSRLLARLMMAGGVWLGENRNESEDSAEILKIVEPFVSLYYPLFAAFFDRPDGRLMQVAQTVLAEHLRHAPQGAPWGWKLCETGYALPFFNALFPDAWFVHLVRDGRDVAFCDHVHPANDFWRKVYFGTDRVHRWRGGQIGYRAYRRQPHVFNAQHWVNSVTTARFFGASAGARYIELRYEDIIANPLEEMRRLFGRMGMTMDEAAVAGVAACVHGQSLGKFRRRPLRQQRAARAILSPTLEAFGYGLDDPPAPDRLSDFLDLCAAVPRRLKRVLHAS